ncbi:MAG: hypothetical protein JWR74_3203 [Polaromonas sp.]|nr:hypothetical protein [Polaromonas sp.]
MAETNSKTTGDRELLELAAKAAGISLNHAPHDHVYCGVLTNTWNKERNTPYWSPLTDDGDALRLAEQLELTVIPPKHPGDGCTCGNQTVFRDDPAEQYRRAIVRAAAAIGAAK